jgi:hypothetical protein
MISYSRNSVLWIHHEFEGGVLDVYYILYFPHLLGGFLHICALYMYYICGLWPPDNVSCLFLTGASTQPTHTFVLSLVHNPH